MSHDIEDVINFTHMHGFGDEQLTICVTARSAYIEKFATSCVSREDETACHG